MDVAYVSALSALAGSVIGGLTSGGTTWLNQRSLARGGQLAHELSRSYSERVLMETTSAYFEPNRMVPELRELIKIGTGVDPLKDFAEAVREERRQFARVYATFVWDTTLELTRLRDGVHAMSGVDFA